MRGKLWTMGDCIDSLLSYKVRLGYIAVSAERGQLS